VRRAVLLYSSVECSSICTRFDMVLCADAILCDIFSFTDGRTIEFTMLSWSSAKLSTQACC